MFALIMFSVLVLLVSVVTGAIVQELFGQFWWGFACGFIGSVLFVVGQVASFLSSKRHV